MLDWSKLELVDKNNTSRQMALSQSYIVLVLLQVVMIKSGILCFDIIIFFIQIY